MSEFKSVKVVDNFYQNNLFFPMPTVAVSTVSEDGTTNIGSYSLVFPYYIAGKDYYAMIIEVRNSSNTAQNILRGSKVALNFITDDKKYFKELVRLGFPGKTTSEKMKDCLFTLIPTSLEDKDNRPNIVKEAYQVIECSWDDSLEEAYKDRKHLGKLEGVEGPYHNFNGITSKFGAHFILKIDNIMLKEEYADNLKNGLKRNSFPKVPVDYGYHDSKNFWYSQFKTKPISFEIANTNSSSVDSVMYCAERLDTKVKFTKEACELYVKIPRPFMKAALLQIAEIAEANGIEVIDKEAALKIAEIKKSMK